MQPSRVSHSMPVDAGGRSVSFSDISARIQLLRIILIVGILCVHIPFNASTSPYQPGHDMFDWIRILLGDVIFRAGVPCLSAISGYLLFRNGAAIDYPKVLRKKMLTLLVPFFIWNTSLYVLVYITQGYSLGEAFFDDLRSASTMETINLLFAVTDAPINLPLYFLRDLWVCIMLTPLIAYCALRWPVAMLVVLFAFTVMAPKTYLFLRPGIAFYFSAGAILALHGRDLTSADRYAPYLMALFLACSAAMAYWMMQNVPEEKYYILKAVKFLSLLGVLAFWTFSSRVKGALLRLLTHSSRYSFWLFSAHFQTFIVLWMIWNKFTPEFNYAIFYVGSLLFTVALLIALHRIGMKLAPRLITILSGGR